MNSRYGWVMVALGALMSCVAVGAMFSLAPSRRSRGARRR